MLVETVCACKLPVHEKKLCKEKIKITSDTYKLFMFNHVNSKAIALDACRAHSNITPRSGIHDRIARGALDLHLPRAKNNL